MPEYASNVRQIIGEPDPFRYKYQSYMREVIGDVIRAPMGKAAASEYVKTWAEQHVDASYREQFIKVVEIELTSLHEGNFARYKVSPAEFAAWRAE